MPNSKQLFFALSLGLCCVATSHAAIVDVQVEALGLIDSDAPFAAGQIIEGFDNRVRDVNQAGSGMVGYTGSWNVFEYEGETYYEFEE